MNLSSDICKQNKRRHLTLFRGIGIAVLLLATAGNTLHAVLPDIEPWGTETINKVVFHYEWTEGNANMKIVKVEPAVVGDTIPGILLFPRYIKGRQVKEISCSDIKLNLFGDTLAQYNVNGVITPTGISNVNGKVIRSGTATLRHLIIPEGVEQITRAPFQYCNALLTVVLPSTLKLFHGIANVTPSGVTAGARIYGGAFCYADNLQHIVCLAATPPDIQSSDVPLFSEKMTGILHLPTAATITKYTELATWGNHFLGWGKIDDNTYTSVTYHAYNRVYTPIYPDSTYLTPDIQNPNTPNATVIFPIYSLLFDTKPHIDPFHSDDAIRNPNVHFVGWDVDGKDAKDFFFTGPPIHLYARWQAPGYDTITYKTNKGFFDGPVGDSVIRFDSETRVRVVQYGSSFLDVTPSVHRDTFLFAGWATSPTADTEDILRDPAKPFLKNDTLYARWGYQVIFEANPSEAFKSIALAGMDGRTRHKDNVYLLSNDYATSTAPFTFSHTGLTSTNEYNFFGWEKYSFKDKKWEVVQSSETAYQSSFVLAKDSIIRIRVTAPLKDVPLYLHKTTGIEFVSGEAVYKFSQTVTINCAVKAGYSFSGWYDKNSGEKLCADKSYTFPMTAGPLNLEARTTRPPNKLTLAKDVGINSVKGGGDYLAGTPVAISYTLAIGYNFDGWYDHNGKPVSASFFMPDAPLSYTARAIQKGYVFTLAKTTGITSVSNSSGTYNANDNVTISCAVEPLYSFLGWFDTLNNSCVSTNTSYTFKMPAYTYHLEARTTVNTYKITTSAGNGIASTSISTTYPTADNSYLPGTKLTLSYTLKPGYTFTGWYDKATGERKEATVTMPIVNLAYEARAGINTHSLTIQKGEHIATITPGGPTDANQSVTVRAEGFLEGYEFDGWYTIKGTGANKVAALKSTANPYTFTMPDSDETYEARTKAIRYNVTITKSAGISSATVRNATADGKYPTNTTISLTCAIESRYTFDGWYANGTVVSRNTDITFTMPARALAYEARASINSYTVSFDYNYNNAPAPFACLVEYDKTVTIPNPPLSRTGYTFAAWYADKACTVPWIPPRTITANLTVYAQWTPGAPTANEYFVTFDANAGGNSVNDMPKQQTVKRGNCAIAPTVNPNRDGYDFIGWYDTPTSTYLWYFITPILTPTTIYAGWRQALTTIDSMDEGVSTLDLSPFTLYYDLKGQRILSPESGRFYIIVNPTTGQRRKIIYL